jgi:hypothetical protein
MLIYTLMLKMVKTLNKMYWQYYTHHKKVALFTQVSEVLINAQILEVCK